MIAILLLASGAALCVSLVLFFLLRQSDAPGPGSKSSGKQRGTRRGLPGAKGSAGGEAGPAQTARLSSAGHSSSGAAQKLSPAEREEMLEGVKNLAENDPQKVAGLIRNWMNEDESPPRS